MYTYPIDYDLFTTEEVIKIVEFFKLIEDANEGTANKNTILKKHKEFRSIINSISMEKQIDRAFEKVSGYSIYKTIKNLT